MDGMLLSSFVRMLVCGRRRFIVRGQLERRGPFVGHAEADYREQRQLFIGACRAVFPISHSA
jgi:hypothetical protein